MPLSFYRMSEIVGEAVIFFVFTYSTAVLITIADILGIKLSVLFLYFAYIVDKRT